MTASYVRRLYSTIDCILSLSRVECRLCILELLPLAIICTAPNTPFRGVIAVFSPPRRASRDIASLYRALAVIGDGAGGCLEQRDMGGRRVELRAC